MASRPPVHLRLEDLRSSAAEMSMASMAQLMEDGRRANRELDFALAEAIFSECYRTHRNPEARISGANMLLKMGRVDEALSEYKALQSEPSRLGMHSLNVIKQKI
eukprot:2031757-Prymnesium_polylepis.1